MEVERRDVDELEQTGGAIGLPGQAKTARLD